MDNEKYIDLIQNQIKHDKLIYSIKSENREKAIKLLEKKKLIIKKNGLFADFQLKLINKKINKLK